jgi:N-acetylglucosamine-6-phosphate deacetylase
MLAFTAARLISPTDVVEQPLIIIEHGRISEISSRRDRQLPVQVSVVDLGEGLIAPGYIDLHIHGSAGFDVMDDNAEALRVMERLLSRHGVTSYFPTTVTAALDTTLRALERLAFAVEQREKMNADGNAPGDAVRATPQGIHLEGPFISHARRGVHPPQYLLAPTLAAFEKFWQAARGRIRMMTIAPELEGAAEVIAEAARRGVCVSLGHSDADFAAAERGIALGARHATHTFNAMRPLDHRNPGILGAVLSDTRVSADIIADGVHLDPAIVKLFALAKGAENAVLITDAISATGMPDGRYRLGSLEVDVQDGKCMSGGKLAGSVLTMDRAVRNLSHFAEWELSLAVRAATRNPARAAQFRSKGNLVAGADADFVLLTPQGEVLRTFIGGVECPE